jgi:hypothetical protein
MTPSRLFRIVSRFLRNDWWEPYECSIWDAYLGLARKGWRCGNPRLMDSYTNNYSYPFSSLELAQAECRALNYK